MASRFIATEYQLGEMTSQTMRTRTTGFTLIELLIVLAILGIIAAIVGQACHGGDSEVSHDPDRQVVPHDPDADIPR